MTTANPRHRSNSIVGTQVAFSEAQTAAAIGWPETVTRMCREIDQAKAEVIFADILRHRPASEWLRFKHDLSQAARLSAVMVSMDTIRAELDRDGYISMGGKSGSTPVVNPAMSVLSSLQAISTQISRALHISLGQKDAENLAHRTKASADAAETLDGVNGGKGDDGLLASFN